MEELDLTRKFSLGDQRDMEMTIPANSVLWTIRMWRFITF